MELVSLNKPPTPREGFWSRPRSYDTKLAQLTGMIAQFTMHIAKHFIEAIFRCMTSKSWWCNNVQNPNCGEKSRSCFLSNTHPTACKWQISLLSCVVGCATIGKRGRKWIVNNTGRRPVTGMLCLTAVNQHRYLKIMDDGTDNQAEGWRQ